MDLSVWVVNGAGCIPTSRRRSRDTIRIHLLPDADKVLTEDEWMKSIRFNSTAIYSTDEFLNLSNLGSEHKRLQYVASCKDEAESNENLYFIYLCVCLFMYLFVFRIIYYNYVSLFHFRIILVCPVLAFRFLIQQQFIIPDYAGAEDFWLSYPLY